MPRPTFRTTVAADQRFVFLPYRKSAMADQDHRRSLVALSVGKARTLARLAKCCVLRAAGPLLQTTQGSPVDKSVPGTAIEKGLRGWAPAVRQCPELSGQCKPMR